MYFFLLIALLVRCKLPSVVLVVLTCEMTIKLNLIESNLILKRNLCETTDPNVDNMILKMHT